MAAIPLQDLAQNSLVHPTTATMLGYTTSDSDPDNILGLEAYNFIYRSIRDADAQHTLLLKRFVEGTQSVWKATQRKIVDLLDLWDLDEVPDELLQYMKHIVGWVKKYNHITDRLDSDSLRRLIGASVALWKIRGRETAISNMISFATAARNRIWNWFDYRWVLDETELSEEHQGRDPWMLNGPDGLSEYESNLRIVDDGTLDRTLIVSIVKLMRAASERFEISYIDFLDTFKEAGDDSQWDSDSILTVSSGTAKFTDTGSDEHAFTNVPTGPTWTNYLIASRMKGTGTHATDRFGLCFYATDKDDCYKIGLATSPSLQKVELIKVVSGTPTVLTSATMGPSSPLYPDVFYTVRVVVTPEGATNRIKVYLDGNEIISHTDSTHSSGKIGFYSDENTTIEVDDVELFQLPLGSDYIDINS